MMMQDVLLPWLLGTVGGSTDGRERKWAISCRLLQQVLRKTLLLILLLCRLRSYRQKRLLQQQWQSRELRQEQQRLGRINHWISQVVVQEKAAALFQV